MVKKRNILSDKLVIEKTGKPIEEWFKKLDKLGAKKMAHAEIFNLISKIKEHESLGQWNQNLLTTSYEWSRGLKERGQREDGLEISASRTIQTNLADVFQLFTDENKRIRWLFKEEIRIRKATENRSVVITWSDNTTVRVELYKKGESKSMVVIQQMKIPDLKTAERMKKFWKERLDKLKMILEN